MIPIFAALAGFKMAKQKMKQWKKDTFTPDEQKDPLEMDKMDPEQLDYNEWRDEYIKTHDPARDRLKRQQQQQPIYGRFER